ncbi:MAG: hypothetical protein ACTSPI_18190 [Candidatus Heimdallarchaeaceae archaeon]
MNKELRLKELEKLSHSSQGDALREEFKEQIAKLRDASNYDPNNFEVDGLASVKAAEKFEKILKNLQLLEKPKKTRIPNQYV